jgi:hypothetical protein
MKTTNTDTTFLERWAIELCAQRAGLDWRALGTRFDAGGYVASVTAILPSDEASDFRRAVEAIDFHRARQLRLTAAEME